LLVGNGQQPFGVEQDDEAFVDPGAGAGAWHGVHIAGAPGGAWALAPITCATAHYCLTFDYVNIGGFAGAFAMSTRDPTSNSPSAWGRRERVYTGRGRPASGSCFTSGLCLFVGPADGHGAAFMSAGPGKPWTNTSIGGADQAVSCASSDFCVAVGPSASNISDTGLVSVGQG
jgi:hypothetical protein